jgi:hypothetical protein
MSHFNPEEVLRISLLKFVEESKAEAANTITSYVLEQQEYARLVGYLTALRNVQTEYDKLYKEVYNLKND